MRAYDVIKRKRDGKKLTAEEVKFVVDGFVNGSLPDYQMSAFLMAVFFKGMDEQETFWLTDSMRLSGDLIGLEGIEGFTVDKHSTGGVGDKTSLVLGPVLAALGLKVAKMSGRGLGHTGGTIDKLESIAGFSCDLPSQRFIDAVNKIGVAIVGQTGNLVPADKKIYALRDVTATVDSIPLIAASIMSKKLAVANQGLVLDVKVGSGAFMKNREDATELARTMVDLGTDAGVNTVALLTDMSVPLGLTAGNALEVRESVEVLAGGGPADVVELTVRLAEEMLDAAGRGGQDVAAALKDGRAMDAWKAMISAQGGDPDAPLPTAKETQEVRATASGVLSGLDAYAVGVAAWRLGAGRARKEDPVQAGAGIEIHAKPGDEVREGDVLLTLHTDTPERFERAVAALDGGITIAPAGTSVERSPIVIDRIA